MNFSNMYSPQKIMIGFIEKGYIKFIYLNLIEHEETNKDRFLSHCYTNSIKNYIHPTNKKIIDKVLKECYNKVPNSYGRYDILLPI